VSVLKQEYPPLLIPGLHKMTLGNLDDLCVQPFPLSKNRSHLLSKIQELIAEISNARITSEVWVNGSFLTEKINPSDSDLVVRVDGLIHNNLSIDQEAVLNRILKQEFDSCDSYLFYKYPKEHYSFWEGEYMYAEWLKQFGFSRGEELKGVAVIETPLS